MPGRRRAILLALLVAAAVLIAPGTALADTPPSWSLRPASDDPASGSRSYFDVSIAAGQAVQDFLTLTNPTDHDLAFRLYAADAYTTAQGAFALRLADQPRRGVGAWVSLPFTTRVVASRTSATFPFQLGVPRDTAPGDWAGGIVATEEAPAAGDASNLRVEHGVGVRLYVRVIGALHPALTVTRVATRATGGQWWPLASPGRAALTYEVANTGNVRLGGTTTLRVSDVFGRTVRTFSARTLPELLPGERVTLSQSWFPVGGAGMRYTPHLVLQAAGRSHRAAAPAFWCLPWASGSMMLALLGGAAALAALNLRRRAARARRRAAGTATIALTAIVLTTLSVALVSFRPASAATRDDATGTTPTIALSVDAATVGEAIEVEGRAWPGTAPVTVEVCGDGARAATIDCDVLAGRTAVADADGRFRAALTVRNPPVPCPCVVWAFSTATTVDARAPLGVFAAPYAAPASNAAAAPSRQVALVRTALGETSWWREALGLPTDRTLRVTVRNLTQSTLRATPLVVTVGRGDDPTHEVVPAPDVGMLQSGAQHTVRVRVHLDALSVGSITVKGRLGSSDPIVFRHRVTNVPWALPSWSAALAVIGLLVARRRREPSDPEETVAVGVTDAAVPGSPPGTLVDASCGPASQVADVTLRLAGFADAHEVALCGEFNDWSPDATPMRRTGDSWAATVALECGRSYRYRFLVDGSAWENGDTAEGYVANPYGSEDCIVAVRSPIPRPGVEASALRAPDRGR